mgnify:CR=1 FL=1
MPSHFFNFFFYYRCEAISASDYIEFSNYMARDRKHSRYCGQLKPFFVESEREFFRVTFRSNDRLDGTGFQAFYQFIGEIEAFTPNPILRSCCSCLCYYNNNRTVQFTWLILFIIFASRTSCFFHIVC